MKARTSHSRSLLASFSLVVFTTLHFPVGSSLGRQSTLEGIGGKPQLIYSSDLADPWNRVFYHLFSRTIRYRLTDEFAEGAPFTKVPVLGSSEGISVSVGIFERFESGDRAIEPFYPSFLTNNGIRDAVIETRLPELTSALSDSLNEPTHRPPLHRALMQADLWAAHDELARPDRQGVRAPAELTASSAPLLPVLARLIRKLALTKEEIASLPDTYLAAAGQHRLPDFFVTDSEK